VCAPKMKASITEPFNWRGNFGRRRRRKKVQNMGKKISLWENCRSVKKPGRSKKSNPRGSQPGLH